MIKILRSPTSCFEVDGHTLGQSWLGQDPITLCPDLTEQVTSVYISQPFGRFGNNFYQIANAAIIAARLDARELQMPPFQLSPECHTIQVGATLITNRRADQETRKTLSGHFYAPFGLEPLFEDVSTARMTDFVRPIVRTYYRDLVTKASAQSGKVLAAHFRGGDIYDVTRPAHPWYVQPPAAYYIFAITHALRLVAFDEVRFVVEDLSNPAIDQVRRHFEGEGVPCVLEQRSLEEDVVSLLSASCIVASSSTLPESIAVISDRLESIYAFRSLSSQIDFRPFYQSRIGAAVTGMGVRGFVVDDSTCMYTPQKAWSNSEAQRERVVDFAIGNLRIYAE